MDILLAGTGASQGIPAFRCECEVCCHARNSGVSLYKRRNSCAVITPLSGRRILIDAPPQLLSQLDSFSIDDRSIRSLLLSHKHDDHILGLFYTFGLSTSKGGVVENPIDIYLSSTTKSVLLEKFKSLSIKNESPGRLFNLIEITELESYSVDGCGIVPLETNHLNMKSSDTGNGTEKSFGYMITEGAKNLYYLVDAPESLPDRTLLFMKKNPPDCIVVDCTYSDENENSGHGDIASVIVLRDLFPTGRMVISHIGHRNYKPDKLKSVLKPHNIEVGFDGMIVSL